MSSLPISANRDQRSRPAVSDGQKGIAMILAIMAVFLLTMAVLQTKAGVDLAEEIAVTSAQETQAFYLARSGLALVSQALAEDDTEVDSYSDDWAAANDMGAIPIADAGWVVGKVSDEEGKFNVLDLVNQDGETDEDSDMAAIRLEDLLLILGLDESRAIEIVDSLIDWMDYDDSVTGSGAENNYYASLVPSYPCANANPGSVEDLALVKGIGQVLLHDGEGDIPPLEDYITVHGKKKAGDRFRRVNINTAPLQVIEALSPEISLDLAEEIVAFRDEEPFGSAAEIKDVPGFPGDEFYSNELAFIIDTSSDHFSARVTGETSSASSNAYGVFTRKGGTVSLVYYKGF